ncbi:phosphatase PAP2 family protein [Flavobacteriales bacterium]|nr:phosphatase PAP2 family protein [Flavobacteriales bacterium]
MIDTILELDSKLFLFLNQFHSSFFDDVMYWVSHKFFWIPLYGFIVFLLFKKYGLKKALVLTLLIIVTFALCNTISVEAFKNVFHRLRPCHNEDLNGLVHLVNDHCGGQWGFVSSHATNVFGLATLSSLFLSRKIKYFSLLIFLWAAIVSYSRIYLGVHYPLDLFCGALLGISIASIIYVLAQKFGLNLKAN